MVVFWGLVGIFSQVATGHFTIIQTFSLFFCGLYHMPLFIIFGAMVQTILERRTIVVNKPRQVAGQTISEYDLTRICGGTDRSHHPLFDNVVGVWLIH